MGCQSTSLSIMLSASCEQQQQRTHCAFVRPCPCPSHGVCVFMLLVGRACYASWLMDRLSMAKSIRAATDGLLYATSSEWKESLWNMTWLAQLLMLLMPVLSVISSPSGALAYNRPRWWWLSRPVILGYLLNLRLDLQLTTLSKGATLNA